MNERLCYICSNPLPPGKRRYCEECWKRHKTEYQHNYHQSYYKVVTLRKRGGLKRTKKPVPEPKQKKERIPKEKPVIERFCSVCDNPLPANSHGHTMMHVECQGEHVRQYNRAYHKHRRGSG